MKTVFTRDDPQWRVLTRMAMMVLRHNDLNGHASWSISTVEVCGRSVRVRKKSLSGGSRLIEFGTDAWQGLVVMRNVVVTAFLEAEFEGEWERFAQDAALFVLAEPV